MILSEQNNLKNIISVTKKTSRGKQSLIKRKMASGKQELILDKKLILLDINCSLEHMVSDRKFRVSVRTNTA